LAIAYHLLATLFITWPPQATLLLPLASFCDLVSVISAITSSFSITVENFLEHRLPVPHIRRTGICLALFLVYAIFVLYANFYYKKEVGQSCYLSSSHSSVIDIDADSGRCSWRRVPKFSSLVNKFHKELLSEQCAKASHFFMAILKKYGNDLFSQCASTTGDSYKSMQENIPASCYSMTSAFIALFFYMEDPILKNNSDGSENESLLQIMNRTLTIFGSRLLRHWVSHPLYDQTMISACLHAVSVSLTCGGDDNHRLALIFSPFNSSNAYGIDASNVWNDPSIVKELPSHMKSLNLEAIGSQ
ncbi:hypothetical protein S245_066810, partial [Arachis hypogaea]